MPDIPTEAALASALTPTAPSGAGQEATPTQAPDSTNKTPKKGQKVETAEEKRIREEQEALKKELVPEEKNLRPISFGVSLEDGNRKRDEPNDMGGRYNLEEAKKEKLEHGEQVDLDWELFERISGPLEYFYTKRIEAVAAGKADFEEIAQLSPWAQATLADYEVLREKAAKIRELRKSKDKKEQELGKQARVFSSGLEYQRALNFLEQTEIIATHALGYELTNDGKENLSFLLTDETIDLATKGEMPSATRQAIDKIAEAIGLSDPRDQARVLVEAISAVGITEFGTLVGLASGNPLLGLAVGAGGSAAVVAGEMVIGQWILSLPEKKPGEGIAFNLRFNPNLPVGSPAARIVDSPMGRLFLARGEPDHHYTSNFITRSEETRHAIYRRLGLRVEDYGAFNWNHITPAQERFIKRLGIRKPLFRSWDTLGAQTKTYIEEMGSGKDSWMINLNPTSLSISGTETSSFHAQVRRHIQNILSERDRNLPSQAISTGDVFYDFSNLSPDERHEIMGEAHNRMGADICSKAEGEVLQRIMLREEGRADALAQLTTAAEEIKTGKKVVQATEITEEVILAEQRRLAEAKGKVTRITSQGEVITAVDAQLTAKKTTQEGAQAEYNRVLAVKGTRGDGAHPPSGEIAQHLTKISDIDTDIGLINQELGIDRYDATQKLYPTDSILGQFHKLDAEVNRLTTDVRNKDRHYEALKSARVSSGELTTASSQLDTANENLATTREQHSAVKNRKEELEGSKRNLTDNRRTEETAIKTAEGEVQAKKEALDAVDREITQLQSQRQEAVNEIRRLTGFTQEYGTKLYNTLLAQANAQVSKVERELREKGIPFELTAEEVKIVSEVDKKRAEGMEAIHTAGNDLGNILGRIWKGYDAEGLSDPKRCQETLLRIIFGKEVLSPDKRAFYERLLSKSAVVEELMDTVRVEGREAQFFHGDNEGRLAFESMRRNSTTIDTFSAQTRDLRNEQPTGWENQIKILEERLHRLQDENIRLSNGLFDKYVPSFLGHSRFTDGEFVRKLVDRMIVNANNFEPFTDTVQYGERLVPHLGADGSVTIRPPDVNPTDGSLINRGAITWVGADTLRVAGRPARVKMEVPISSAGRPTLNIEFQAPDIRSLHAILPPTLAGLPAGSSVFAELNRLGLLGQLYDAGGNKVSRRTVAFQALVANAAINEQVRGTVWQLNVRGVNNAGRIEAWLRGAGNFNFQGVDAGMFRSVARAFAERIPVGNSEAVARFRPVRPGGGNYEVRSERGELRLYRYRAGGNVETTVSLHDLLYTFDSRQRNRLISRRDLDGVLYEVGKNLFENIRSRRS